MSLYFRIKSNNTISGTRGGGQTEKGPRKGQGGGGSLIGMGALNRTDKVLWLMILKKMYLLEFQKSNV